MLMPMGCGPQGGQNKKWLPPPVWTPGGQLKWAALLWQLELWKNMTATPPHEQGPAVALSVGGRAQRIAQKIQPGVLAQPQGLGILLYVLEYLLDVEELEMTISCSD